MTDNQQNEGASVEQTEVNPDLPKFHISLEMKRSDGNYGSMAVTLGASNVTEENIEATLAGVNMALEKFVQAFARKLDSVALGNETFENIENINVEIKKAPMDLFDTPVEVEEDNEFELPNEFDDTPGGFVTPSMMKGGNDGPSGKSSNPDNGFMA